MSFSKKQHKTRKHKKNTRKTLKRGGYMYINANLNKERTSAGQIDEKYKYGKEETSEYPVVNYDRTWIPPRSFIDSLTNVSIVPNNNVDYRYFGMLIMIVSYPNDVSTIKWSIDKYLEKYVLPVLLENNKQGINYTLNHIKINDFKINYNAVGRDNYKYNNTSLSGEFFITGSIYVYDSKKLDMGINKKVYNRVPDGVVDNINEYIPTHSALPTPPAK